MRRTFKLEELSTELRQALNYFEIHEPEERQAFVHGTGGLGG